MLLYIQKHIFVYQLFYDEKKGTSDRRITIQENRNKLTLRFVTDSENPIKNLSSINNPENDIGYYAYNLP